MAWAEQCMSREGQKRTQMPHVSGLREAGKAGREKAADGNVANKGRTVGAGEVWLERKGQRRTVRTREGTRPETDVAQ